MPRFQLSRRAEADLLHIGACTLDRWGEHQADKYLAELEACCHHLAQSPLLDRSCRHIRPGLHCMEQGSHVIFYRRTPGAIFVTRILHRHMLPTRHLAEE
ncbi:MAG TPA: type II toxin-antitoxin system RelE/ParE family toxin [Acidobacteriaceae bacterium]|nr:type II toxin-antitoxin system RelE/ParE family toxin [Acidobacteriaceae bacterium]